MNPPLIAHTQYTECIASLSSVSSVLQRSILIGMESDSLASAIRARIKELGISQRKYAERIGMTSSHINQIVKGRIALPSADVRRRLANDLGMSHLDLLILAGEINRLEVEKEGITSRSEAMDVPPVLIRDLARIEWDQARVKFMRTQIQATMELLERSASGVQELVAEERGEYE